MSAGAHVRLLPKAEEAGRQLIHSWIRYGPRMLNHFEPDAFPTGPLQHVAGGVLQAMNHERAKDLDGIVAYFVDAPDGTRAELIECTQGFAPMPSDCGPVIHKLHEYDRALRSEKLSHKLQNALAAGEPTAEIIRELVEIEVGGELGKSRSMITVGVNSFPTEMPPESILLGNGWLRRSDIATFISTAGAGKSVAVAQAAMAWGLGLPYLGIHPARPLRILLFSGEDDDVTIGQCREGFLEHSKSITGRQLTAEDLTPLDSMMRTEFSRKHVGPLFFGHLAGLLRESPVDLVLVNPLLSYIGGEIVACVSEWLRSGLMPILQQHDCGAFIAHHTGKMARDGWETTDDTYSAIGGGEIANIPRAILTLRPTKVDGLSVVKVSKRQTTGWKDGEGNFTSCYFVKRSGNPERPAWIPVDSDQAHDLIGDSKASGSGEKPAKKVTSAHVVDALKAGPTQRQALIERLRKNCNCSDRPARVAIIQAEYDVLISSFTEPNPRGGNALKWLCLPEHKTHGVV